MTSSPARPGAPPTGRRGRPRVKGRRLGTPAEIAARAKPSEWRHLSVSGRGEVMALVVEGLWYSVLGPRAVRAVIVRESCDTEGYRIALITTDLKAPVGEIVARYADRWSIEVAFQDAKQTVGVGEAGNRVGPAVERTVPFGLLCQSLVVAWYALHADPAADVDRRRRLAPWYFQKRDPSMLDVLATVRRELIRAEFRQAAGRAPSLRQITACPPSRLQAAA
ncbi:MAG: hypothetical protein WDZ46_02905 [Solirubrobacterales bacterium]